MIKDSKIKVIYNARSNSDLNRIDSYNEDNHVLPTDYSSQWPVILRSGDSIFADRKWCFCNFKYAPTLLKFRYQLRSSHLHLMCV